MQQDAASFDTLMGRQDVVTGSARHVPGRGWIAEPGVAAPEAPAAEGSAMPIQGSFRGEAMADARTVTDEIGPVVTGAFRGEGGAAA
ncbi:hypothetical protein [uncultured Methylibium sp.]|uniref:hypothetical protein n=1 Tax=uncultured Methylibium sp. TaxID=381093 RepID=UPI0025E36187|nr:hypothetical protein [uncultured Methylibium sp.]